MRHYARLFFGFIYFVLLCGAIQMLIYIWDLIGPPPRQLSFVFLALFSLFIFYVFGWFVEGVRKDLKSWKRINKEEE